MDSYREQLEFLMSQLIDGQLSDDEAERLERRLAEDSELQAEFERMKRLHDLLGQWRKGGATIDKPDLGRAMSHRVGQDVEFAVSRVLDGEAEARDELVRYAQRDPNVGLAEHTYRRLEMSLQAWGAIEPAVDHALFAERLYQMIRRERPKRHRRWPGRIIQLYVPLAAAASLLIAVGAWWTMHSLERPLPAKGPAQIEFALVGPPKAAPHARPVAEFSFSLSPNAGIQSVAKATESGGSGIVITIGGANGTGEGSRARDAVENIF